MLFEALQIRDIVFRNRIVVSPMCEYSSDDGFANDWHLVHLGSRAVGGAALVMTEATAVRPEGRISPEDLGLWKDDHIPMLERVTRFIESQGAVPGIQLAHAGRKASTAKPWAGGLPLTPEQGSWAPVAPSAVPFDQAFQVPEELTRAGIDEVKSAFLKAARRALQAGFKVLEIHSAHGYLLHEFLSPVSNKRTDQYGGSLENRMRLLREIVSDVKTVWPKERPLFVRISATDWLGAEGWDIEQSVCLAHVLKKEGVDLIDCSSGALVPTARIPMAPGFQVPFAERIRKETGILTGAVGLITSAEQAETILKTGQADMIFLAREFLRDPYWPLHAAGKLKEKISWPNQYARAAN
ncbi:MAG: NADPH dehydrogenase NamA [Candidatus Omnitrophica bacterium]|nr:NADPH dehydrogenase NamA [Candidatus Omnitrophota bacterium]